MIGVHDLVYKEYIVKQLFPTVFRSHAAPQDRKLVDIELCSRRCVGRAAQSRLHRNKYPLLIKEYFDLLV